MELADVSTGVVHPPETMPFGIPWTDVPAQERGRGALQHVWRTRGDWTSDAWHCALVVIVDGSVVGMQSLEATQFAVRRTVGTGSWLLMDRQGQGIGKEMRAAVLHLAFAGLGALRCESAAFEDNAASLGVSRALGYVENGDETQSRRGEVARLIRLVLPIETWETHRRDDIAVEGLEPCLELFGAVSPAG